MVLRSRRSETLNLLSDAPSGCVGAGGAPGEAVIVKGGATTEEPVVEQVGDEFVFSGDKDNQSNSGTEVVELGNLGNGSTDCSEHVWLQKTVVTTEPATVRSDASGRVWLVFGIDSGFESFSHVYLLDAEITLSPSELSL